LAQPRLSPAFSPRRRINRTQGARGAVWARDDFDRFIRHDPHFSTQRYIQDNPVKAGLGARPEQWAFSSAAA
jgi:hypothetical protein